MKDANEVVRAPAAPAADEIKVVVEKDLEKEASNQADAKLTGVSPMTTLKFAYLSLFIDILGLTIAIPVLPYFQRQLGASDSMSGLIFSTYAIASALSQSITGCLSDKYGRRPMLLLSIFGSSMGFLLTGLAKVIADGFGVNAVAVLFIVRFIAGASGNSQPVVAAMVADCTQDKPEERPKYYGLIGATIGIGFTVGPGLGALALMIIRQVVDTNDDGEQGTLAFSCVLFSSAVICFAGFIFACLRLRESRSSPQENKSVTDAENLNASWKLQRLPLLMCPFLFSYCFATMQSVFGFVLQDVYISNTEDASAMLGVVLFGSGFVIAPMQGGIFKKVVAKIGLHYTCALGAVLLGSGTILVGISAQMELHLVVTLLFFFLLLIVGFSFVQPSMSALAAMYAPQGKLGTLQGLMSSSQTCGLIVGPIGACALYDIKLIYAWCVAGASALSLMLPLFIASRLRTRYMQQESPPTSTQKSPKTEEVPQQS